ncbi:MAG: 50S ribosomal protein L11 methyltransferase [Acidimicrobiia bacterium]
MSTTPPAIVTIAFAPEVLSPSNDAGGGDLVQFSPASVDEIEDALWFVGAESISRSIDSDGRVLVIAGFHDVVVAAEAAAAIPQLAARQPGLTWAVEEIVDDSWMDEWKAHARPVAVGDRLVIWPSWLPIEEGSTAGREVVLLDPGRAFGSGAHPSTVLVLEELSRLVRPGDRVLDLGCGSGVLAIAAVILGAGEAVALDIDPVAIEVTSANAALNAVADRIQAAVVDDDRLPAVDVALANIGVVPLRERLAELERAAPIVVLAGLLTHQAEELAAAATGSAVLSRPIDGWQAVTIIRRS